MQEHGEIARPYAVAAFKQAREEGSLPAWAEMLATLETVVRDPLMSGLIANPKVDVDQVVELILDVAPDLSETGRNFVKVLGAYRRLALIPGIRALFDAERARQEGRSDVVVTSAYELSDTERDAIAGVVGKKLGTEVTLNVEVDESLIGGVVIRAGDMVIDASLRGRLAQLGQALT